LIGLYHFKQSNAGRDIYLSQKDFKFKMQILMNYIDFDQPGDPSVLNLKQGECPTPNVNEVLIKVAYAGVNRPDCLQRAGAYPPPKGASEVLGLEISGEIVGAGSGVDEAFIGNQVMALTAGGGYAEYCLVDVRNVLPIPSNLSMKEAACIPETFFTVWHNVFQLGKLQKGDVFLVHGGSSGIGTTAIQLAKAFGASVIATAGSVEKCNACRDVGADYAIDYTKEDFVERVKQITNYAGANVILDMVGGSYIERNYSAAAIEGRIIQIAFLGGVKTQVNFVKLMMKRLVHTGSTLRARSVEFKEEIANALQVQVWPLIESQKVKPVIHSVFDLKDANKAHALMESNAHIGKIVLKV